jgi:8-hydroxy-5-deazaflavin:NADPH oxidoreductase
MKIAVFGTGIVGQSLAGKLDELGHEVMVGTRDPEATLARTEGPNDWTPAFSGWHADHPRVALGTYAEAAVHGEMLVNATAGLASLDALRAAGEGALDGKVLIDISNSLDFSQGMPPFLAVSNKDSLGEQIQRTFPRAKVVKALNTVTAPLMVNPGAVAGGDHDIFVSGDDADAKATVTELLQSFGWQRVTDLGDITTARGTEMLLALWIRLVPVTGSAMFNVKVVR